MIYDLNLIPKKISTRITCSVADTTPRKWAFALWNDEDRWNIDADSVDLECSNGTLLPCTILNNEVIADCTEDLSRTAGRYYCKLKITKGSMILHTQAFALWAEGLNNAND